jgi:hypothetical protein
MPVKFALHMGQLKLILVKLCYDFRTPAFGEKAEFLLEVDGLV